MSSASTDESGFLGYTLLLGRGGPYVVQYWSSVDKLYAYAVEPLAGAPARMDPLQPGSAQSAGRGRHLARDLPGRARRERLRPRPAPMGLPGATEVVPIASRHDRATSRMADGQNPGSRAVTADAAATLASI